MNKKLRFKMLEELVSNLQVLRSKLVVGFSGKNEIVLTPTQGMLLKLVSGLKKTNVKTIAKTLNVTSSAATQLVDTLVNKGYLVREMNQLDRRESVVYLSKETEVVFKEYHLYLLKQMNEMFSVLSDEELERYCELNRKICQFG